jgi:hypothetical protein
MEELALYKLIMTPEPEDTDISYVQELGWINDKECCVWVSYLWIKEFIDRLKGIFGNGLFDDGGFMGNIQEDCICIDLCEALGSYIDIETVSPKNEFRH